MGFKLAETFYSYQDLDTQWDSIDGIASSDIDSAWSYFSNGNGLHGSEYRLGSHPIYDLGRKFTLGLWIQFRHDSNPNERHSIGFSDTTNAWNWEETTHFIGVTRGYSTLYLSIREDDVEVASESLGSYANDEWHFIEIIIDMDDKVTVLVNEVEEGSYTHTFNAGTEADRVLIANTYEDDYIDSVHALSMDDGIEPTDAQGPVRIATIPIDSVGDYDEWAVSDSSLTKKEIYEESDTGVNKFVGAVGDGTRDTYNLEDFVGPYTVRGVVFTGLMRKGSSDDWRITMGMSDGATFEKGQNTVPLPEELKLVTLTETEDPVNTGPLAIDTLNNLQVGFIAEDLT